MMYRNSRFTKGTLAWLALLVVGFAPTAFAEPDVENDIADITTSLVSPPIIINLNQVFLEDMGLPMTFTVLFYDPTVVVASIVGNSLRLDLL
ncbi:MAG: hypothetical protein ACE1ZA_16900, partial [Pseudomonadales bacterium]